MPKFRLALVALPLIVVAGSVVALPVEVVPPDDATLGCIVRPSQAVDVGTPVAGVVRRVHAERGDSVAAGQVVATLQGDVERASVKLAAMRAGADAESKASIRGLELALRKLERTEDLRRQGFLSEQAVDGVVAERDAAAARRDEAAERSQQSRHELQVASAQLGQRTIRSPIAGIVVDVYRHPGERVEDKPILKVVTIDPLYVDVVLAAKQFGRLRRGQSIEVQPMLAGLGPVQGTVLVVDSVIDPASNTLRARIVLPNPGGGIPAGIRCSIAMPGIASAQP